MSCARLALISDRVMVAAFPGAAAKHESLSLSATLSFCDSQIQSRQFGRVLLSSFALGFLCAGSTVAPIIFRGAFTS